MEPTLTNQDVPRYTQRPLPAYRHLPFRNPHPFLDRDGHSYGEVLTPSACFDTENWRVHEDYLYAVDLFNHGFWWEAHERLKQVSIGAGRESATGRFVEGLIQVAAALLKLYMNEPAPARTLADLGLKNLRRAERNPYLGIDAASLQDAVNKALAAENPEYPSIRLIDPGVH